MPSPRLRLFVRAALVLLAAAGLAGGVFVLAVIPPGENTFYPRCQLHSLTGLHCPGCGTTRALHALLNGRVAQALAYNAPAFVILPVAAWSLLRSYLGGPRYNLRRTTRKGTNFWVWVLLGIMVVYGVLRNIPSYPFTLLAPHEL